MRVTLNFAVLAIVLLLVGCGAGDPGPDKEELSNALKLEMPSHLELRDLEIEVSQNVGSEV